MSTRNSSSKSMHAFFSNLANRQTDRQTRAKTCTSCFVGGSYKCLDVFLHAVEYFTTSVTLCAGVATTTRLTTIQQCLFDKRKTKPAHVHGSAIAADT